MSDYPPEDICSVDYTTSTPQLGWAWRTPEPEKRGSVWTYIQIEVILKVAIILLVQSPASASGVTNHALTISASLILYITDLKIQNIAVRLLQIHRLSFLSWPGCLPDILPWKALTLSKHLLAFFCKSFPCVGKPSFLLPESTGLGSY